METKPVSEEVQIIKERNDAINKLIETIVKRKIFGDDDNANESRVIPKDLTLPNAFINEVMEEFNHNELKMFVANNKQAFFRDRINAIRGKYTEEIKKRNSQRGKKHKEGQTSFDFKS